MRMKFGEEIESLYGLKVQMALKLQMNKNTIWFF
jgi:hypothetical protein